MTGTIGNEMPRSAGAWVWGLVRRWPTALGLATAAVGASEFVGATTAAEGVAQAVFIAVPVLVYLTAAVTGRPTSAWPVVGVATALVFGMVALDVEPVLGLAAASAAVLVVGVVGRLWRGGGRPATGQIVGAVGFGAASVLALYVAPALGGFVVGAGLIGHAVWDIVHHHRDIVVVRSLSEFCAVLDVLLGVAVIVLTMVTMG
jgi:hypothetical protein